MPRPLLFPLLLLASALCPAVPSPAAPSFLTGLPAGPHGKSVWGSVGTGPGFHLRPGEEGPLERLAGRRCTLGAAPAPGEVEPAAPVWGNPVQLTWSAAAPVRCSAALDASYAVPDNTEDLSLGEALEGERFRAWVRSGVQWRYLADTVLALDARWSPAGLHGLDPAPPFQAAATVTVPW